MQMTRRDATISATRIALLSRSRRTSMSCNDRIELRPGDGVKKHVRPSPRRSWPVTSSSRLLVRRATRSKSESTSFVKARSEPQKGTKGTKNEKQNSEGVYLSPLHLCDSDRADAGGARHSRIIGPSGSLRSAARDDGSGCRSVSGWIDSAANQTR